MSGGKCGKGKKCCGGCALRKRLMALEESLAHGVWSRETASPSCQSQWDPANPTVGQCAVTALLVQDIFGGELLRAVAENRGSHYFNRLPNGWDVDYTRAQFPKDQKFGPAEVRTREYVLDSPAAVAAKTKERHLLLKAAYDAL